MLHISNRICTLASLYFFHSPHISKLSKPYPQTLNKGLKCPKNSMKSCHHIYSFRNNRINEMSIFIRSRNPLNRYLKSIINLNLFIDNSTALFGDNLESSLSDFTKSLLAYPSFETLKMLKTNMYSLIVEERDCRVFQNLLASYLFNTLLERTIKRCHVDNTNQGLKKGLNAFRKRQTRQGRL